jgi:hypothetical protein
VTGWLGLGMGFMSWLLLGLGDVAWLDVWLGGASRCLSLGATEWRRPRSTETWRIWTRRLEGAGGLVFVVVSSSWEAVKLAEERLCPGGLGWSTSPPSMENF